ncbi:MAG: hypothetical protein JJT90_05560 [Ectothiorhodospiraceae bacterium]|nr:hypothetical protein [Ectothiorhodospiraceae bacterium]
MNAHVYRIFLSSPGDVTAERDRAKRVCDKLNAELGDDVRLEPVRWEDAYYTAAADFQSQIPRPSECDAVLCILWKRLGTPLPSDRYRRPDGSPYDSGTEYEFEEAFSVARERRVPDIFVYRKTEKVTFDAETAALEQAQWQALRAFWEKWIRSPEGHFTAAFHQFISTDEFEVQFERHLRQWLNATLARNVAWPPEKGSPFRGLQSFEEEHAPVFFGRRRAVDQARALLAAAGVRGTPYLLVLGMSGAGKSSLVQAGLIPRLRTPGAVAGVDLWRFLTVRPSALGDDPVAALAQGLVDPRVLPELAEGDFGSPDILARQLSDPALASIPIRGALDRAARAAKLAGTYECPLRAQLLLCVDQFEELFAWPAEVRERFSTLLNVLVEAGVAWVVATLRSDSYPAYQEDPMLVSLKDRGAHFDLTAPGEAEIGEIIRKSAEAAGLTYEKDGERELDRLLEEAARTPGALPLLGFTLDELYKRRDPERQLLTLEAYDQLGGLAGAIERRAEDAYSNLPEKARATLPRVLRALVRVDDDGNVRRRYADLKELRSDPARRRLVDAFIDARLFVTAESERPAVSVAHEALFTQWARARQHIETDRSDISLRAWLRTEADRWERVHDRSRRRLLERGERLEEARSLVRRRRDELPALLVEFVDRSAAAARRVRQSLTAAVCLALLLISAAAVVAAVQWRHAERNFNVALQATDNLALEIVRQLEGNFDVPTREKIFVAERLEDNFAQLIERVGESSDLNLRYAELLLSNALMLNNVGRHDLAEGRVERASALLSAEDSVAAPLLRSRGRFAQALQHRYAMSFSRAEAALDEAQALLERAERESGENGDHEHLLLRARIEAERAELLLVTMRHLAAADAMAQAQAAALRGLEEFGDKGAAALHGFIGVLMEVGLARYLLARIIGSEDIERVAADLREQWKLADVAFAEEATPQGKYYQALLLSLEAESHSRAERTGEAIDVASNAINELEHLVLSDYGNLIWRSQLAAMLANRSGYARSRKDYRQAEVDLADGRTLAVSLKRDSANAYLVNRIDAMLDYSEGELHLARGELEKALHAYSRAGARVAFYRGEFDEPHRLNDFAYFAQFGLLRVHVAKEQYTEALEAGRLAVAALKDTEALTGPGPYAHARRYFVHQALLAVPDPSALAEEWAELYAAAEQDSEQLIEWFPDAVYWRSQRAYLASLDAARLVAGQRNDEAAARYQEALDWRLDIMARDPRDQFHLLSGIYFGRERLRSLIADGDWEAVLATAAQIGQVVSQEVPEPRWMEDFSVLWGSFISVLESGVATAEDNIGAELRRALNEELQRGRDLQAMFLQAMSKAALAPAPAGGGASEQMVTLDPRSLDLSSVREGEENRILIVNRRLGFASRPVYHGVWRTIIEDELAEAMRHFDGIGPFGESAPDEDIERVRKIRLPFYDDGVLFEAEYTDPAGSMLVIPILVIDGQDVYFLNGTSPAIHEANATAPIRLRTASEVAAYLRFFGAYVAGHGGGFHIVETEQELTWTSNAPAHRRLAVGRVMRPLVVWQDPESEGGWRALATLQYDRNVFHALFTVHPTGMPEMEQDLHVASDLPLEPPLYTPDGRLDRVVQMLDLERFGETRVTDEAEALEHLASLPEGKRPPHYERLAREAAALRP